MSKQLDMFRLGVRLALIKRAAAGEAPNPLDKRLDTFANRSRLNRDVVGEHEKNIDWSIPLEYQTVGGKPIVKSPGRPISIRRSSNEIGGVAKPGYAFYQRGHYATDPENKELQRLQSAAPLMLDPKTGFVRLAMDAPQDDMRSVHGGQGQFSGVMREGMTRADLEALRRSGEFTRSQLMRMYTPEQLEQLKAVRETTEDLLNPYSYGSIELLAKRMQNPDVWQQTPEYQDWLRRQEKLGKTWKGLDEAASPAERLRGMKYDEEGIKEYVEMMLAERKTPEEIDASIAAKIKALEEAKDPEAIKKREAAEAEKRKKVEEAKYKEGEYYVVQPDGSLKKTTMDPNTVYEWTGKAMKPVSAGLGENEFVRGTKKPPNWDAYASDYQLVHGESPAKARARRFGQDRLREMLAKIEAEAVRDQELARMM